VGTLRPELPRIHFADLLSPHGVVQAFLFEQCTVCPGLGDPPFFQDVDGIGVEDGAQPVGDQDHHVLRAARYVADGRCKTPVGCTVDVANATWTNTIGVGEMITV